ncbi:Maf family protein [Peredibacter starrii]|uniref:dTTP/UTP pyrophosphatase n=1 Tax=Peredibacter starrii TaxID=28202 RepID=A0AAX4HLP4_9BACT|nr:Maf family protein [Peredibacter starrii]WPU64053.1 Maf family protein [Peredibacter starrii]
MGNSKFKLVLASASPRRKELIGHLKVPYEILALNVPEESNATDPVKFSAEIAALKGDAVFTQLRSKNDDSLFVVSADTIVCLNGKIYGKPKDRSEARQFLSELGGRTHSVFTAVSVKTFHQGKVDGFSFVEESKVTFNSIPDDLMERYLNTGDSLDKAGAYGIQGPSLTFISKVDGDYANVVGFPLSRFVLESEKFLKSKFKHEGSWLDLF